jgi:hypothetical protein
MRAKASSDRKYKSIGISPLKDAGVAAVANRNKAKVLPARR